MATHFLAQVTHPYTSSETEGQGKPQDIHLQMPRIIPASPLPLQDPQESPPDSPRFLPGPVQPKTCRIHPGLQALREAELAGLPQDFRP